MNFLFDGKKKKILENIVNLYKLLIDSHIKIYNENFRFKRKFYQKKNLEKIKFHKNIFTNLFNFYINEN